jgi:sulfate permease, SulP family
MKWSEWVPGVAQLRSYERAALRGDLPAGLTVAAYLVPQVMAYATLAGLSPIVGLWAALLPLAFCAMFGSSRQLTVGPESTTALMTTAVLTQIVAGDSARYAVFAVLALLVGIVCVVCGLARLGFLANLLSRPVLVGYMTGVAVVVIGSQVGKITGARVSGDEFIDQIRSFAAGINQVHRPTTVLAVSVLALLLAIARWTPRAPGPLIAVLAATGLVAAVSLDRKGIAVVGQVPSSLATPSVPVVTTHELAALVMPAVGIAIVAFSDNVLTARFLPRVPAKKSTPTRSCAQSGSATLPPG